MLVSCAAYQDGRKIADIEVGRIPEYLDRPNSFVWVALREPTAAELDEMRVQFNLHPLAVEDAQAGHERPKLEEYGGSLFAVLHLIEETARHAGHMDITRELLDGSTGR